MAVGLQLGVNQALIDADFEPPSFGRQQGERFDLSFEFIQQFGC